MTTRTLTTLGFALLAATAVGLSGPPPPLSQSPAPPPLRLSAPDPPINWS